MDLDNLAKSIIDSVADGLLLKSPNDLKRHTDGGRNRENGDKYFWTLFFHRFPNASTPEEEGVAICESRRSEDTARVRP